MKKKSFLHKSAAIFCAEKKSGPGSSKHLHECFFLIWRGGRVVWVWLLPGCALSALILIAVDQLWTPEGAWLYSAEDGRTYIPCGRQPRLSLSYATPPYRRHIPLATPQPLGYATPSSATPHLLSYATPSSATPDPPQLRHTLLSYATPSPATPHSPQLRHTLLSYATPSPATPHSPQLRHSHTLLSYATPSPAMPHSPQLRHTLFSYANPYECFRSIKLHHHKRNHL